jgi:hypothetical protein
MTRRDWLRAFVTTGIVVTFPFVLVTGFLLFHAMLVAGSRQRVVENRTPHSIWVIPVGNGGSQNPTPIAQYASNWAVYSETPLGELHIPPGESRPLVADGYVESDFGVAGLMIRTQSGEFFVLRSAGDRCMFDDLSKLSRTNEATYTSVIQSRPAGFHFGTPIWLLITVAAAPVVILVLLIRVDWKLGRRE